MILIAATAIFLTWRGTLILALAAATIGGLAAYLMLKPLSARIAGFILLRAFLFTDEVLVQRLSRCRQGLHGAPITAEILHPDPAQQVCEGVFA